MKSMLEGHRHIKVLVVEPDETTRSELEQWLGLAGYEVRTTTMAHVARTCLACEPFSLLITELALADEPATTLIADLARIGHPLPVVVICNELVQRDLISLMRQGVVDVLQKPLSSLALISCLERVKRKGLLGVSPHNGSRLPTAMQTPALLATTAELCLGDNKVTHQSLHLVDMLVEKVKALHEAPEVFLPVLDNQLGQLMDVGRSPTASINEMIEAIAAQPALVSEVMRVANLAEFRRARAVNTLQEACLRLGNQIITGLAQQLFIGVSLKLEAGPISPIARKLWTNARSCALIARRLGRLVKYPNPDELFVAGLLHNIGELVVLWLAAQLQTDEARWDEAQVMRLSLYIQDVHESVGGQVLKHWLMPPYLIRISAHHHSRPSKTETLINRQRRRLVRLAWELSMMVGLSYLPTHHTISPRRHLAAFNIEVGHVAKLLDISKETLMVDTTMDSDPSVTPFP